MSDKPNAIDRDFDPDESPFEVPAIEGIPYEKGSEEDLAIRRVLEEADGARKRPGARTA
jgi:hypothetical protein